MANILIIPALNPDYRLVNLVKEITSIDSNLKILIVDDGSDPIHTPIFNQLKKEDHCLICRHPENYGKGSALKTGIAYARKNYPNCKGFVTADADGQHSAVDILRVSKAVDQHPKYLVLGSRDFSGKDVPRKSRWGNRVTSYVFRILSGTVCHDTQTGLRGFSEEYADFALAIAGERFEYEMNFLLHFGEQTPFMEIPIETLYHDNNKSSHFHPFRDAVKIYQVIFSYWIDTIGREHIHKTSSRKNLSSVPSQKNSRKL